jgi:hypothetical protein
MRSHPTKVPPKFSGELFRDCSAGKAAQQVIAVIFMSVPDVRHLDAALIVKGVRVVQPFAEATG